MLTALSLPVGPITLFFCLNCLYGKGQQSRRTDRLSAACRSIFVILIEKVVRFAERCLEASSPDSPLDAFLEVSGQAENLVSSTLSADAFDLLESSGGVDPMPSLDPVVAQPLLDESLLFPDPPQGLNKFANVRSEHRAEYVLLVARQLRAGKVRLARSVNAGATIFPVAKKDSIKQREVWSGDRVSLAAARPPKPPDLASPSALLGLECTPEDTFLISKRDARCWFDQLKLPEHLALWFGRPPVSVADLISAGGFSLSALQELYVGRGKLSPTGSVFPVSSVFPMGFSWSSWIAQSKMLDICVKAGLGRDRVLSDSRPPPLRQDVAFGVATDDVMVFTRSTDRRARRVLRNLDRSFQREGAAKHPLGTRRASVLTSQAGVVLSPNAKSLSKLFSCMLHIALHRMSILLSPKQAAAILGVMQWHCQLNRPSYAIFHHIYEFTKQEPDDQSHPLPTVCFQELLQFLFLSPLLEADLARGWHPEIVATDASQSFGFGLAVLPCDGAFARTIGRLAAEPGVYAELDTSDPTYSRPRAGIPRRIGVHMGAFSAKLSIKAQYRAHSGSLEAAGVSLLLRWLARRPHVRSLRVSALVDAQAVLGALRKGRSSAPTLRFEVRRVAALVLATNLQMHYVYVPSGCNPGDPPSRGLTLGGLPRQKPKVKKTTVKLGPEERAYSDWKKSLRKCRAYQAFIHGAC